MPKRSALALSLAIALVGICLPVSGASQNTVIGINVLLNTNITDAIIADLGRHGAVRDVVYDINAITLQAASGELDAIRALPYVAAADPDAARHGAPVDGVPATDFCTGMSTWNLDAINITDLGSGRMVDYNGAGVYVAVLDTGLLDSWRLYFPQERIAEEYGIAFGGGGGNVGNVSSQPLKWEHDQNSHGTHVISTILGYWMAGGPLNGVAPMATVIPVKVLNQNGSGWSSVIARGITYVADLKAGPLADSPVVINMSLGGPRLDLMEKAAIDYAISKGVIVVASAGNEGAAGMGYPGAYAPVISVAASGWIDEWVDLYWWYNRDVPESQPGDFYVADFSSRQKTGQDLDVAAPGSWVVGPYQYNSGQASYYYLSGTSMASPHVAGVVALMAQKNPALTATDAESILESTAVPIPAGCSGDYCWDSDAAGAGIVDAAAALEKIDTPTLTKGGRTGRKR